MIVIDAFTSSKKKSCFCFEKKQNEVKLTNKRRHLYDVWLLLEADANHSWTSKKYELNSFRSSRKLLLTPKSVSSKNSNILDYCWKEKEKKVPTSLVRADLVQVCHCFVFKSVFWSYISKKKRSEKGERFCVFTGQSYPITCVMFHLD